MIGEPNQTLLSQRELLALLEFAKARRSKRRTLDIRREGPLPTRRRGAGLELEESRPYQIGDEVRHMDWRATARSGRAMTKTFHDEKAKQVWIWLDRSPYMNFGSGREIKATQAARLAVLSAFSTVLRHGEVSAIIAQKKAQLFHRLHGLDAVLRFVTGAIAPLPALPTAFDPTQSLELLLRHGPRHGHVVLVSDFAWLNDTRASQIIERFRLCSVFALHVYDRAENTLPERGYWRMLDPTGDRQITVDAANPRLRRAFHDAVRQRDDFIASTWRRAGATYLRLATDDNHLDTLADQL